MDGSPLDEVGLASSAAKGSPDVGRPGDGLGLLAALAGLEVVGGLPRLIGMMVGITCFVTTGAALEAPTTGGGDMPGSGVARG